MRFSKFFTLCSVLGLLITGCGSKTDSAQEPKIKKLKPVNEIKIQVPEPSGLAFHAARNTLFTASDQTGSAYELALNGDVLQRVFIETADLEGIAFSRSGDTMYIAQEATNNIVFADINGKKLHSISKNVSTEFNQGLEGIAVNEDGNIVVINEKNPLLIIELNTSGKELQRKTFTDAKDISSIDYDTYESCYWLLSDESKMLFKLDKQFKVLSKYKIPVKQAEGVAASANQLYIISDPDETLYIFKKP